MKPQNTPHNRSCFSYPRNRFTKSADLIITPLQKLNGVYRGFFEKKEAPYDISLPAFYFSQEGFHLTLRTRKE
jgi:hypothetical protein